MLHRFGKEGMITIPLPGTVQAFQEQVSSLQCFQKRCTVQPARQGIAERPGQAHQETCLQEKASQFLWLGIQHFSHKVVEYGPMTTCQSSKVLLDLLPTDLPLEREGEHT